ncbi:hypothetical protein Tco_1450205 [Tanacetum coccineum]
MPWVSTDDDETENDDEEDDATKMNIAEEEEEENAKKVEEQNADEEQQGVPSVVEDYLGSSLPDAFKKVLQSHTEEFKKELSEKKDYKYVIEESVQANVINEVKNFLPKFLPKAIKDALEKTSLPFAQSFSPDQSAIKAT